MGDLFFLLKADKRSFMGAMQNVRIRSAAHHLALMNEHGMQVVQHFRVSGNPGGNLHSHDPGMIGPANIKVEEVKG
jgi:hypothetical protein